MRDDRSSTDEPRTPVSATSSAMFRRAPLPAVKGTMGGIESPRRELFSPAASTLRASTSPAPSTQGDVTSVARSSTIPAASETPTPSAPAPLVFRSDPRMVTAFDGLPEGAEEIKAKFGVA
ncbi:unnamed protein product [Cutaneotrichosporon oleaginosum]